MNTSSTTFSGHTSSLNRTLRQKQDMPDITSRTTHAGAPSVNDMQTASTQSQREKILSLKAKVSNGSYCPDSRIIAAALLKKEPSFFRE